MPTRGAGRDLRQQLIELGGACRLPMDRAQPVPHDIGLPLARQALQGGDLQPALHRREIVRRSLIQGGRRVWRDGDVTVRAWPGIVLGVQI